MVGVRSMKYTVLYLPPLSCVYSTVILLFIRNILRSTGFFVYELYSTCFCVIYLRATVLLYTTNILLINIPGLLVDMWAIVYLSPTALRVLKYCYSTGIYFCRFVHVWAAMSAKRNHTIEILFSLISHSRTSVSALKSSPVDYATMGQQCSVSLELSRFPVPYSLELDYFL